MCCVQGLVQILRVVRGKDCCSDGTGRLGSSCESRPMRGSSDGGVVGWDERWCHESIGRSARSEGADSEAAAVKFPKPGEVRMALSY